MKKYTTRILMFITTTAVSDTSRDIVKHYLKDFAHVEMKSRDNYYSVERAVRQNAYSIV